jgi:IS5 family transposase
VLRTSRVRADTTVVAANVCYPTDSGLLAKAIRRIGAAGQRIHHAGGAVRTRLRDRSRAAGKRAHGIAAKLRSRRQLGRDRVKDGVARITGELADLAAAAARDAQRLLSNARRTLRRAQATAARLAEAGVHDPVAGRRRGRLARAVGDLSGLLEVTEQIIGQTGKGSPG